MKKLLLALYLLYFTLFSCNNNTEQHLGISDSISLNKFSDETILAIAKAQYYRDTKTLGSFLSNENPEYRAEAAMAFASVQDSLALIDLSKLLNDKEMKVRIAAAFAIGQTYQAKAATRLYAQLLKEENDLVKKVILESIGKCGDKKMMRQIISFRTDFNHEDVLSGKALALTRFSIRGFADKALSKELFTILASEKTSTIVKYYASIALSRKLESINHEQLNILTKLYKQTSSIDTKLNLVLGAGKNLSDSSLLFLISVFQNADDYRLRINALRSLAFFDYEKIRNTYFKALTDSNINVAIHASKYFMSAGMVDDATVYLQKAEQINNWRVRANMYRAANRYAQKTLKQKISKLIIQKYHISTNDYEKAWLLNALGANEEQWQFIEKEIYNTDIPVIRSVGMDALAMAYDLINTHNKNKQKQFVSVFKKAILSGDIALISVAAGILRNPDFGFKQIIKDFRFLNTAAQKLQLPKELETYLELQKTLVYYQDSGKVKFPKIKYKKIAWKDLKNISPSQKVLIKTSKGNILIELNVEDNPATVSTFIKLINKAFYNNLHIHRVVPNFVIQDGCPRGDGWGSPDFSIRSEFYNSYYKTGSLGMASAGKDTESSQWFITHSPTPHLDGRYTKFGKVIEGMDIVHKIEVGDEIYKMVLIN